MSDELTNALDDLEKELDDFYDESEPFGDLDGEGYTRVWRAWDGLHSIRQYLEWRENKSDSD